METKKFGSTVGTYSVAITISPAPKTGAYGEHDTSRNFYLSHEQAQQVWALLESLEKQNGK